MLHAKKINLLIFIKSVYNKIYKEEIRLKADSRHHLVRVISCQYVLNSISIPFMQCSLLKWTASQICIFAFSYLSLDLMDLLLLKDTNFCRLWESSWPLDGGKKKKKRKVEGIKSLGLKIAVRTNQQETTSEQYIGCLWPFLWQSLTATSSLTDVLLWAFSTHREVFSWSYLGVLSPAFKTIPNQEGLVLFEPTEEAFPQTQPHLYATSPIPVLLLGPLHQWMPLCPHPWQHLWPGLPPPLPKWSCPHFALLQPDLRLPVQHGAAVDPAFCFSCHPVV